MPRMKDYWIGVDENIYTYATRPNENMIIMSKEYSHAILTLPCAFTIHNMVM